MNRRSFLAWLVKGGGAVVAGVIGIPALLSALSPVFKRNSEPWWVPVGPLDSFEAGGVSKAVVPVPRRDWGSALREKGVFVWRTEDSEVVVFSRNCTDLSCPVNYDPGSGWFFCPCHGGIFSEDGTNVAGPPPRPLYRYASRVQQGVLEIDLNSLPPFA
jgi:menaquinol-cytochrome c reductase iron-sulfur subunit